jgi:hypothetical protein
MISKTLTPTLTPTPTLKVTVTAAAVLLVASAWSFAASSDAEDKSVGGQRLDAAAVYSARTTGLKLYDEKKYEEAFPHLMIAAKRGFKMPQAQLGFMHQQGLGGAKKDTRYAVGWLGVAASGTTEPSIKNYFDNIWDKIPAEHQGSYEKLVGSFVDKYGAEANDVKCQRVNRPGSQIRVLRCQMLDPDGRILTDTLEDEMRYELGSGQLDGVGGQGF